MRGQHKLCQPVCRLDYAACNQPPHARLPQVSEREKKAKKAKEEAKAKKLGKVPVRRAPAARPRLRWGQQGGQQGRP